MLSDLEELILRCRDDRAKQHIAEAVGCYRVGAYRASIIATWIAVCFDLVDKFAKLALSGDAAAQALVDRFENVRRSHDVLGSLKFERDILIEAGRLELLSPVQIVDIKRLAEDRNRCAHPSMADEGEAFQPPAELARLHVTNSVRHLLAVEPVQGKAALDALLAALDSNYFPTTEPLVVEYLRTSAIARPRRSLFDNFFAVVVKNLTRPGVSSRSRSASSLAFRALRSVQPALWKAECERRANAQVDSAHTAADLTPIWHFLCDQPDVWALLTPLSQAKIIEFCKRLPEDQVDGSTSMCIRRSLQPSIND